MGVTFWSTRCFSREYPVNAILFRSEKSVSTSKTDVRLIIISKLMSLLLLYVIASFVASRGGGRRREGDRKGESKAFPDLFLLSLEIRRGVTTELRPN